MESRSPYEEMMKANKKQKEFYEITETEHEVEQSLFTKIWSTLRTRQIEYKRGIGLGERIEEIHRAWMGDLQEKKVLDLGCHTGTPMSIEIAEKSDYYLGIDLSETAIQKLRKNIQNIEAADADAVDFLSNNFSEKSFDLVYAHSVFHHFEYFESFIKKLKYHTKKGASIVTYDPLQTAPSVKLARRLYRPFQSDSDWEFPFTRQSVRTIKDHFEISDLRGILGAAKWGFPIYMMNQSLGKKFGRRLEAVDHENARSIGPGLWKCMQVTMHLKSN